MVEEYLKVAHDFFKYDAVRALAVVIFSAFLWIVARRLVSLFVPRLIRKTKTTIDDAFVEHKFFNRLVYYIPFIAMNLLSRYTGGFSFVLERASSVGISLTTGAVAASLLSVGNAIYERHPVSRRWPLRGYVQVVKLVVWVGAGIAAVCALLNRSPWSILSGLGAMSAVLMLVFRHTLLSFVATFQVLSQNLIQVGDWIEMPKYGVDGEVVDITLPNLVVRNWDNTLVVVPSYRLLEDSFKNWRGMELSGGRRIKRAIYIDQSSIRFCDEAMIERFKKVALIKDYIERKLKEIEEEALQSGFQLSESPLNGRRLTNVGTFRVYIKEYLKRHPMIRKDMTLMVRQLQPTPQGLPLEVYCFVADTRWVPYEEVQADIFDHILASVSEFGLRIYQFPTDTSLESLSAR